MFFVGLMYRAIILLAFTPFTRPLRIQMHPMAAIAPLPENNITTNTVGLLAS
jgi:hypothetical protein